MNPYFDSIQFHHEALCLINPPLPSVSKLFTVWNAEQFSGTLVKVEEDKM